MTRVGISLRIGEAGAAWMRGRHRLAGGGSGPAHTLGPTGLRCRIDRGGERGGGRGKGGWGKKKGWDEGGGEGDGAGNL